MKRSNMSFLLAWFMVGFSLSYILLNSSKWVNGENAALNSKSSNTNRYGIVENRKNSKSTNYVRLPAFRTVKKNSISKNTSQDYGQNAENNSVFFAAQYQVADKYVSTITSTQHQGVTGVYLEPSQPIYHSNRIERDDESKRYSELTNINTQIPSLNFNGLMALSESSNNTSKTNHGFLTLNTDLSPLNSDINDGLVQKVDEGGGGGEPGVPVPVGDGWIFMFVLALSYGFFKSVRGLKINNI